MSLSASARQSVLWNTGFNIFRDLLQFAVMLMLVRLISPQGYGQFALANTVIGIISVLAFQSFVSHAIQLRDDLPVDYQSHFTLGALVQISLFMLTNIVALILGDTEGKEELSSLLHVLSVAFLLEWPAEIRRKMLERELNHKRLRALQAVGITLSAILAIALAMNGLGVWALVVPGLLVTIPITVELFFVVRWRPNWSFDYTAYLPSFRFGFVRMLSSCAVKLRLLFEAFVVQELLGLAALGILVRSVGLASIVCTNISMQLMYAVHPVLSKIPQKTMEYRRAIGILLSTMGWFSIPVAVLVSYLAEDVVLTIYGENWIEVIPLMKWALYNGVTGALTYVLYIALLAHQEEKECLMLDTLLLIGNSILILFFLSFGLETYLQSLAGLLTFQFLLSVFLLWKSEGLSIRDVVISLVPPMAGVATSLLALQLMFVPVFANLATIVNLLCSSIVFLIVYVLTLRLFFKKAMVGIVSQLPLKRYLEQILVLG